METCKPSLEALPNGLYDLQAITALFKKRIDEFCTFKQELPDYSKIYHADLLNIFPINSLLHSNYTSIIR